MQLPYYKNIKMIKKRMPILLHLKVTMKGFSLLHLYQCAVSVLQYDHVHNSNLFSLLYHFFYMFHHLDMILKHKFN